jgi:hypothetical protein
MGEDLIWYGTDIDDLEMTESIYSSSDECQHYIDEECVIYGTPCPSCGNLNTGECLMNDEYSRESEV